MQELARWDRRRFPTGLKLIRVGFGIAAGAEYRLLLRLAFLAPGSDEYAREVRASDSSG